MLFTLEPGGVCGFTLIETDSRVMEMVLSEEMNVPPPDTAGPQFLSPTAGV